MDMETTPPPPHQNHRRRPSPSNNAADSCSTRDSPTTVYRKSPKQLLHCGGDHDSNDKDAAANNNKWLWRWRWLWRGRWRWKRGCSSCPGRPSLLWPEMRRQAIYMAPPAALANAAWLARFATTAASVASSSSTSSASDRHGAALALTIANATGWTILLGLSTGLEAVSAQMHDSAAVLRRGLALLLLTSLSIAAAWSQSHRLFHGLLRPPVSRASRRFLLSLLPDLAATCFLAPLRAHFRAHSMHASLLAANLAALGVHLFLLHLYAVHPALALFASDALLATLLAAYLFLHSRRNRRRFRLSQSSSSAAPPWKQLLRLAIPSSILACTEAWFYDLLTFLSRLLSPNSDLPLLPLAALHALQAALASSAASRVAHELGASRPARARSAAQSAAILAAVFCCATASASMWLRHGPAALPPAVVAAEAASFLHLAAGGVLRGSGRAWEAAIWNAVGLLGVGLASGAYMGFRRRMGQEGLWAGMAAGVAVAAAGSGVAVLRTDWGKKAADVERMLVRLGAAAKNRAAAEAEAGGGGNSKASRRVDDRFADGIWAEEKMGVGGGGSGSGGGGATTDLGHCWEVSLSMMNESMRKCAAMASRSLQNNGTSPASSPPPSPRASSSSSTSDSKKFSFVNCALKRKFFRRLRQFAASRPGSKKRQKQR